MTWKLKEGKYHCSSCAAVFLPSETDKCLCPPEVVEEKAEEPEKVEYQLPPHLEGTSRGKRLLARAENLLLADGSGLKLSLAIAYIELDESDASEVKKAEAKTKICNTIAKIMSSDRADARIARIEAALAALKNDA